MNAKKEIDSRAFNLVDLTIASLHELYDQTMDELEQCSLVLPEGPVEDKEADVRETALVEFECAIMDRAARVPLKTSQDIQELVDFWGKVSSLNDGADLRPSDRIAMNIFRHLSAHLS